MDCFEGLMYREIALMVNIFVNQRRYGSARQKSLRALREVKSDEGDLPARFGHHAGHLVRTGTAHINAANRRVLFQDPCRGVAKPVVTGVRNGFVNLREVDFQLFSECQIALPEMLRLEGSRERRHGSYPAHQTA